MANQQMHAVLGHLRRMAAAQALPGVTDSELLQRFSGERDVAAFTTLVQRHGQLVLQVCRNVLHQYEDAEDAFQATFLVLARNAGTIRKGHAVGSWLHGVAFRIATHARRSATRRRHHERKAKDMAREHVSCDMACQELQAILDEEIQHLAEAYRAPFVLCCLEGKSRSEAARELGWKEGTVSGRLARAHKQLQARLVRRGVTLSAALCALTLAARPVEAALVKTTVQAAVIDAAGKAMAGGAVSARVAALARGVSQTMLVSKMNVAILVVFLGLATLGAGLLVNSGLAAQEKPAAQPRDKAGAGGREGKGTAPAAPAREKVKTAEVAGRILDPEGKPVKNARVFLFRNPPSPPLQAVSAGDGRFRLLIPYRSKKDASPVVAVMAAAKGYGPAYFSSHRPWAADNLTLRLVKDDVPIKGRVLDLEGKPVAGVTVRVNGLHIPKAKDLGPWLKILEANAQNGMSLEYEHFTNLGFLNLADLFPPVTSGVDGRFQINGVGRERLVVVRLEGPTIETSRVEVRTRPGATLRVPEEGSERRGAKITYYGSSFDHLAGPTLPIEGVVRDQDTKKPLAGVTVASVSLPGGSAYGGDWVQTTTDKRGHYRLTGLPKTGDNVLVARPADDQPYLAAKKGVGDCSGFAPVTVNVDLKRGVLITGRVTDRATGKPVQGQVQYFYFVDNLYRKQYPRLNDYLGFPSKADGSFRGVGLPGHGLIVVRAWQGEYLHGVGADKIKGLDNQNSFLTYPFICHASDYHALAEINPAKDAESLTCDMVVDPGRTLTGTVLGPDGKPLAGTVAHGLGASQSETPLKTAAFTVQNVRAGYPRVVAFLHVKRRLAGFVMVRGAEKNSLEVKLQPWATITGRVVDGNGLARTGSRILFLAGPKSDGGLDSGVTARLVQPDKDGKFRVEGMVPGLKYYLGVSKDNRITDWVLKGVAFTPGQTKDVGDVKPRADG